MRPPVLFRRALLAVLAAAIWILSDQPSLTVIPPLVPGQDKIYHVVEFMAFGAALWMNRDVVRGRTLYLVAAGMLWGALDEIHQSWVPGRDCSLVDFLADAAGICLWMSIAVARSHRSIRADALDSGGGPGI